MIKKTITAFLIMRKNVSIGESILLFELDVNYHALPMQKNTGKQLAQISMQDAVILSLRYARFSESVVKAIFVQ